ncbi:hypothetical protein C8F04DRAFT_1239498 [Mycena alexandri]|uniref:Uncharacterized protein n=1 Tax=Mycena alexandri TaxID=1745969 RepID=A0AAD6SBQ4_9AGAR|nr:hypothetical protein C8F04DRAFT_1239498 [Mycena alexandri]
MKQKEKRNALPTTTLRAPPTDRPTAKHRVFSPTAALSETLVMYVYYMPADPAEMELYCLQPRPLRDFKIRCRPFSQVLQWPKAEDIRSIQVTHVNSVEKESALSEAEPNKPPISHRGRVTRIYLRAAENHEREMMKMFTARAPRMKNRLHIYHPTSANNASIPTIVPIASRASQHVQQYNSNEPRIAGSEDLVGPGLPPQLSATCGALHPAYLPGGQNYPRQPTKVTYWRVSHLATEYSPPNQRYCRQLILRPYNSSKKSLNSKINQMVQSKLEVGLLPEATRIRNCTRSSLGREDIKYDSRFAFG